MAPLGELSVRVITLLGLAADGSSGDCSCGDHRPAATPSPSFSRFRWLGSTPAYALTAFLQTRIPRLSRTRAQAIVKKCARRTDGTLRRASERVRAGETVLIVRPPMDEPPTPQHFDVLYEDAWVLAIDKPSGLPMHPTATYHKHTLSWLLAEAYEDPTPQFAHRLDRETSGVVVCGKSAEAEVALKRTFEERRAQKRYLAIVRGEMAQTAGRIDQPLASARSGLHVRMEARADGSAAQTDYEVLDRRDGATLVALRPRTGRQHQLRVHLALIGHPIVGDKLYGPEGVAPFLEAIDHGLSPELLCRLGHPRQALHAAALEVPHPFEEGPLRIESELPWDLRRLWEAPAEALAGRACVDFASLLQRPPPDA